MLWIYIIRFFGGLVFEKNSFLQNLAIWPTLSSFFSDTHLFSSELIVVISAHFVFHHIFPMCQYMRAKSSHLSIYTNVYFVPQFSDDLILLIFRLMTSLTIHCLLLFGNIKIVRFLISIIVNRSMYGINYSWAPMLEWKSFWWSFHNVIQSTSFYENYEFHMQNFSSFVELLFFPALATMWCLFHVLQYYANFFMACFAFYHYVVVLITYSFLIILRKYTKCI